MEWVTSGEFESAPQPFRICGGNVGATPCCAEVAQLQSKPNRAVVCLEWCEGDWVWILSPGKRRTSWNKRNTQRCNGRTNRRTPSESRCCCLMCLPFIVHESAAHDLLEFVPLRSARRCLMRVNTCYSSFACECMPQAALGPDEMGWGGVQLHIPETDMMWLKQE